MLKLIYSENDEDDHVDNLNNMLYEFVKKNKSFVAYIESKEIYLDELFYHIKQQKQKKHDLDYNLSQLKL